MFLALTYNINFSLGDKIFCCCCNTVNGRRPLANNNPHTDTLRSNLNTMVNFFKGVNAGILSSCRKDLMMIITHGCKKYSGFAEENKLIFSSADDVNGILYL